MTEQYERIIKTLEKRIWDLEQRLRGVHRLLRKSDGMDLSDRRVVVKLLQDITEVSGEGENILEVSQFIEMGEKDD